MVTKAQQEAARRWMEDHNRRKAEENHRKLLADPLVRQAMTTEPTPEGMEFSAELAILAILVMLPPDARVRVVKWLNDRAFMSDFT